jgi:hypothetical protein
MRKLLGSGIVCGVLAVGSVSVAAQQLTAAPACRAVTGTVDIDGTPQQISGLACQQPDGTWEIQQGDSGTLVYPVTAWPNYVDYYGPWYGWWPPVVIGASFVFVDRFHHVYPMHRVYYGHPGMRPVSGSHGGFHSGVWSAGGGHRH